MAQSFVTKWILFLAVLCLYASLKWMIAGFAQWQWQFNIMAISLDIIASWLLFPIVTMVLIANHKFLPQVGRP